METREERGRGSPAAAAFLAPSLPADCDAIILGGVGMAAFKTSGQREDDERGEGLDRSLQQMLRAIVEERNRINIRQEISGLGEWLGGWNWGPLQLPLPGRNLCPKAHTWPWKGNHVLAFTL